MLQQENGEHLWSYLNVSESHPPSPRSGLDISYPHILISKLDFWDGKNDFGSDSLTFTDKFTIFVGTVFLSVCRFVKGNNIIVCMPKLCTRFCLVQIQKRLYFNHLCVFLCFCFFNASSHLSFGFLITCCVFWSCLLLIWTIDVTAYDRLITGCYRTFLLCKHAPASPRHNNKSEVNYVLYVFHVRVLPPRLIGFLTTTYFTLLFTQVSLCHEKNTLLLI